MECPPSRLLKQAVGAPISRETGTGCSAGASSSTSILRLLGAPSVAVPLQAAQQAPEGGLPAMLRRCVGGARHRCHVSCRHFCQASGFRRLLLRGGRWLSWRLLCSRGHLSCPSEGGPRHRAAIPAEHSAGQLLRPRCRCWGLGTCSQQALAVRDEWSGAVPWLLRPHSTCRHWLPHITSMLPPCYFGCAASAGSRLWHRCASRVAGHCGSGARRKDSRSPSSGGQDACQYSALLATAQP